MRVAPTSHVRDVVNHESQRRDNRYAFAGIGITLAQALNGAGDTATPSALNLLCFWLIQIPLAWWLAEPLTFGPNGVFVAIVVSESLLSILSVIVFRSGRWKRHVA